MSAILALDVHESEVVVVWSAELYRRGEVPGLSTIPDVGDVCRRTLKPYSRSNRNDEGGESEKQS